MHAWFTQSAWLNCESEGEDNDDLKIVMNHFYAFMQKTAVPRDIIFSVLTLRPWRDFLEIQYKHLLGLKDELSLVEG